MYSYTSYTATQEACFRRDSEVKHDPFSRTLHKPSSKTQLSPSLHELIASEGSPNRSLNLQVSWPIAVALLCRRCWPLVGFWLSTACAHAVAPKIRRAFGHHTGALASATRKFPAFLHCCMGKPPAVRLQVPQPHTRCERVFTRTSRSKSAAIQAYGVRRLCGRVLRATETGREAGTSV